MKTKDWHRIEPGTGKTCTFRYLVIGHGTPAERWSSTHCRYDTQSTVSTPDARTAMFPVCGDAALFGYGEACFCALHFSLFMEAPAA